MCRVYITFDIGDKCADIRRVTQRAKSSHIGEKSIAIAHWLNITYHGRQHCKNKIRRGI